LKKPPNIVAFQDVRRKVSDNPRSGRQHLTTVTEWTEGTKAVSSARFYKVSTDEPVDIGGTDAAMDPIELLMSALGSCIAIGWTKQAELRNIQIHSLVVTVEASLDLNGYLQLDDSVRPGLQSISYSVSVDADCDEAMLEELTLAAEQTSSLFDNLLNSTPVRGTVDRVARKET